MDDAKRELVQAWLQRARDDLLSARKLSEEPDPVFATALYHCQQTAEKRSKGSSYFMTNRLTRPTTSVRC